MGVLDGSAVSAAITNPAFINKNQDDTMANKLAFARALSGASIADIQQAINNIYSATGVSESNTGTVYNATAGTITNGQSYQSSFTVLANKFDAATGHMHTGAAGDGPILDVVLSASVTGGTPSSGNMVFIPGTGITINQSGPEFTFSSTAVSGVTSIAASGNTPITGAAVLVPGTGITLSEAGQNITITSTAVGGGTKNYLGTVNGVNGNGNFELGTTTKWSLFNTTLTGVIPTGSITAGAASITTFATTSSSPLAGVYSLNIASSGAITAGQGFISDAFTLDIEDMARPITESFFYEVLSGATNLDFSGTSSNTWALYLYDVTNSAWIQPAGVYNLVQNSGAGFSNGTFQTSSNGTQYRLALICVNASLGASSMLFDDFFFGPQPVITGVPATEWTAYTPTFQGFGTVASSSFFSRRVGDTLEVQGRWTSGATSGSQAQISLGFNGVSSNVTIDSTKVPTSRILGNIIQNQNLAGAIYVIGLGGNNYMQFGYTDATHGPQDGPVNGNALFTGSATQSLWMSVPIQGWSSNVQMSNDTSTRIIAMSAYKSGGSQTSSSSYQDVTSYSVVQLDSLSTFNSTTGVLTIGVSGDYVLSGSVAFTANSTGIRLARILKNSSSIGVGSEDGVPSSSNASVVTLSSGIIPCVAGDQIVLQAFQNSGGSLAYVTDTDIVTRFDVHRISGPATIASTETVTARYVMNSSTSILDSTSTIVKYTTKDYDSHGCYSVSTGYYTAPISGKYLLTGNLAYASSGTGRRFLSSAKNGSLNNRIMSNFPGSSASAQYVNSSTTYNLLAGDQIGINAFQSSGGNLDCTSDPTGSFIEITRIGN